jgi:predicted phosphodiesterase
MILMFGDVHGSFKHVLPIVRREKPAAIIFLGDLQAKKPLEQELAKVLELTEVYFIHGNHDTDTKEEYDNLFSSKLADRNLHGKVNMIDGLRVAGLGGIFRASIWYPQASAQIVPAYHNYEKYVTEGLLAERWKLYRQQAKASMNADDWKQYQKNVAAGWMPDLPMPEIAGKALVHKSTIFHNDWMTLYGQEADILVTHEAPSCHRHGFHAIDVLAQGMKAKYTFHGHHHIHQNYADDETRLGFSAHGVGYRAVSNMHGGMISIGESE